MKTNQSIIKTSLLTVFTMATVVVVLLVQCNLVYAADIETNIDNTTKEAFSKIEQRITSSEKAFLEQMTEEEITERNIEINNNYEIGQKLSDEDAKFIVYQASQAEAEATSNRTRTTGKAGAQLGPKKYGTRVILEYQSWVHVPYLFGECWYRTKASTMAEIGSKKINSITIKTYHTAYGPAGSGGVVKVYSGSLSSGAHKPGYKMDLTKKYSGFTVNTTIYTTAYVETTEGKYNFSTPTNSWNW